MAGCSLRCTPSLLWRSPLRHLFPNLLSLFISTHQGAVPHASEKEATVIPRCYSRESFLARSPSSPNGLGTLQGASRPRWWRLPSTTPLA
ncbi:hypothetical protein BDV95DRAFT_270055 [Massariosphaeria phaeospora]|uniref:Uncharacterized protein n=1 Tax=Massariosphaeria phaeospora TaxID=100035 RepID=A0A7C8M079_9PLEO|nr:hypothetical protein BDV95DRAFT_270055 [Massariosphaeria phaeospora]